MKKKVVKGLAIGAGIFSFHAFIGFLKVSAIIALAVMIGVISLISHGVKSAKKEVHYETSMTFYVQPIPKGEEGSEEGIYGSYGSYSTNTMRNIVQLLESEMFASSLLDDMMEVYSYDGWATEKYEGDSLTEEYKEWVALISQSVTFSFNYNDNIAESFIVVSISMKDTKDVADEYWRTVGIKDQLLISVPAFVEKNMPVPSGYGGTNCALVSTFVDVETVTYRNGKKVN